jgi:hypothetical protein
MLSCFACITTNMITKRRAVPKICCRDTMMKLLTIHNDCVRGILTLPTSNGSTVLPHQHHFNSLHCQSLNTTKELFFLLQGYFSPCGVSAAAGNVTTVGWVRSCQQRETLKFSILLNWCSTRQTPIPQIPSTHVATSHGQYQRLPPPFIAAVVNHVA